MRDTAPLFRLFNLKIPCINGVERLRPLCHATEPDQGHMAMSCRRFAVLGQSPFCRGQVSSGADGTALLFASDEQLDLRHWSS